jgi:hypothetical protein
MQGAAVEIRFVVPRLLFAAPTLPLPAGNRLLVLERVYILDNVFIF